MDRKTKQAALVQLRRLISYDEALGKLCEVGISDEFLAAIQKSPELMEAINKIAPDIGPGPVADWSCCITVNDPLHTPGEEVINPIERLIRK